MTEDEPSDPRLEEAMDWLLRLREAPDDLGVRGELETWLAADPDHSHAWQQARKAWQVMGELPPVTAAAWAAKAVPIPSPGPSPARPPNARRKRRAAGKSRRARTGLTLAALAAAACLALVFGPSLVLRLQADHVTAAAETRRLTLEDGSVLHLAPESAIDLRFTTEGRNVALLAGDAFFEVTPNAKRPFVVEAEGLEARVLGTAFGVGISTGAISVEIESGSVGVRSDATAPPVDLRLELGQALRFDRGTGTASVERRAPKDMATWRHGQLLVVDASVAEVVEALRRYQRGWIVIADDRLAAQRVNGLYDLRDPDSALRALVHPAGGRVLEITPLLRILRQGS